MMANKVPVLIHKSLEYAVVNQDGELKGGVQDLIALWKECFAILVNNVIEYTHKDGVHYGEFSNGRAALTAVYTEAGTAPSMKISGRPVFGEAHEPGVLAVYLSN
jgi:hypothetical protein